MMSHPNIVFGDFKPFYGHYQYDRLTNIFCDVVKENGYGFYLIDIMIEEIGTHSIQKGEETYVITGCTISPPMPSICMQKNGSIGGVK